MKIIFITIIALITSASFAGKEKKFSPSSSPVTMQPSEDSAKKLGVGFNKITIISDTVEDAFSVNEAEEDAGTIKYEVLNLAIGILENSSGKKIATETDFLIGIIKGESENDLYYSGSREQNVAIDTTISGFDIGLRRVSSKNISTIYKDDNSKFIEWNWNYSYLLALFKLTNTTSGLTADGQIGQEYTEDEIGLYFRPFVNFQPVIHATPTLSLIPYVGVGTKLLFEYWYWEQQSTTVSGIKSDTSEDEIDEEGYEFATEGLLTNLGFDIAYDLKIGKKTHNITFGGAISKLFSSKEKKYSEVHFLYSVPWGND